MKCASDGILRIIEAILKRESALKSTLAVIVIIPYNTARARRTHHSKIGHTEKREQNTKNVQKNFISFLTLTSFSFIPFGLLHLVRTLSLPSSILASTKSKCTSILRLVCSFDYGPIQSERERQKSADTSFSLGNPNTFIIFTFHDSRHLDIEFCSHHCDRCMRVSTHVSVKHKRAVRASFVVIFRSITFPFVRLCSASNRIGNALFSLHSFYPR